MISLTRTADREKEKFRKDKALMNKKQQELKKLDFLLDDAQALEDEVEKYKDYVIKAVIAIIIGEIFLFFHKQNPGMIVFGVIAIIILGAWAGYYYKVREKIQTILDDYHNRAARVLEKYKPGKQPGGKKNV